MAELGVKVALVPLNLTAVAPVKLAPVITTEVPTGPEAGVKLVTTGKIPTVKLLALVAVLILVRIETLLELLFATARSRSPSPSRSPTVTDLG